MEALLANLALLLTDVLAARLLPRGRLDGLVALALGPLTAFVFTAIWSRVAYTSGFLLLQVLCWWLFLHLPVLLLGVFRDRFAALFALGSTLVAIDAFLIEPRWIEVTRTPLPGPMLRIALLADVQTDDVGAYETAVFDRVIAEDPDLVLFAGDYVQMRTAEERPAQIAKLRALVERLHPRLGGLAVQGDADRDGWEAIFEGTAIAPLAATTTTTVGPLTITALSIVDSRRMDLDLPRVAGTHLVFGHAPDFAYGAGRRDLNLAGHTHGGQVRLPLLGPVVTLAAVPRSAAAGLTQLEDSWLYVSRGIGMERKQAPRIRFLCRPELAFFDVG